MRLHALIPTAHARTLELLEDAGIKTDVELLFAGSPLEVLLRLPKGSIELSELEHVMGLVEERSSAPATRGDHLLEAARASYHPDFRVGVDALDKLLDGFGGARVIEISGDRGSGKTALALQVVLRHLSAYSNSSASWIDTTGDFSAERAMTVLQSCVDQPDDFNALERLQVSLAFDIEAAHSVLEGLCGHFESVAIDDKRTQILVIDTVTPLLGPALSNVSSQGHAAMTGFMRQLRAMAQAYGLAVLVINNSTITKPNNPLSAFASTVRKPALGPSFVFMSDATLWLSRPPPGDDHGENDELRVAEVFRSRTTRSKTWCTFKIVHGVLRDDVPEEGQD